MSSILTNSYPSSEITTAGHIITQSMVFNNSEIMGVWVLVGAAACSLLAVLFLLTILAISAYKNFRTPSEHPFMRTHVVAYFISLLLCDAISAIGSLMSAYWINRGGVFLGSFCTSQGALKNTGNIGTAVWSMVIAIHTFCLVFLRWKSRDFVFYAVLVVVWSFICVAVIIGPTAVQNLKSKGPYFGVSGYWCWISDEYTTERVTLEYFWMFLSAIVSLLLYTVVSLSLRGNLIFSGGRLRLYLRGLSSVWEPRLGRCSVDAQVTSLAKQMLAYPIAYCAIILPISICRFLQWGGHEIPVDATIFADAVFLLSGLVNAIVFTCTRKIVPTREARGLFSRSKSIASDIESKTIKSWGVVPDAATQKCPVEEQQEILVAPVTLPPPILQKPPSGRIKRGVSSALTVLSVYSQSSCDTYVAPPPTSIQRAHTQYIREAVRRSIVAPLNVVRKLTLRRSLPTVPVEATELAGVEVEESSHGSQHHPTGPTNHPCPLPPIPSSFQSYHARAASSSTLTEHSWVLGDRF